MTENTTAVSTKSSVQLGVLFGVIMVLEFVVSYVMNIDPISNPMAGTIMNTFNYLIFPVLLISIACNSYKKANGGYISFGQCLKTGVTLCLIAGLIYALFSVVFNMIFPEFVEEILQKTRAVMLEKSPELTSEQLEMAMTWTRKFMNPMIALPVTLLMFCFLGLIYSLIIGAIVKKDKPQSF
jgi:energy-converting hydrogenase Eha subunit A